MQVVNSALIRAAELGGEVGWQKEPVPTTLEKLSWIESHLGHFLADVGSDGDFLLGRGGVCVYEKNFRPN